MKRTNWLVTGLIVAALPVALSAALAAPASPIKSAELDQIRKAAAAPGSVSLTLVAEEFTGRIEDSRKFIDKLLADMKEQGVGRRFGNQTPEAVMILNEDPTGKSQVPMTIGLSTRGKVDVKAPLKIVQVHLARAACHTHTGPYSELGHVHSAIRDEVVKRGQERKRPASTGFPVVIRLLTDPAKSSPSQVRNEMCVTVKEEPGK